MVFSHMVSHMVSHMSHAEFKSSSLCSASMYSHTTSDSMYARRTSTRMAVSVSLSAAMPICAQYLNWMCTSTSTTRKSAVHMMVYV